MGEVFEKGCPDMLWKPRHNRAWRELQMEPGAHPWDPGAKQWSPITRIAEHGVIWHSDDLHIVKHHHNRAAQAMRDRLSRYKRSCFVEDWEAGASKIDHKGKAADAEVSIKVNLFCSCSSQTCIHGGRRRRVVPALPGDAE